LAQSVSQNERRFTVPLDLVKIGCQQRATVYNLTTKKQLEKKATYGINQLVPFLNKYKGINVATDALSQDLREEFL